MGYLVECHSGHKYGERPTAVLFNGDCHKIIEILSEWKSPTGVYFRVLTADDFAFELKYEADRDEWSVIVI
jgi:hypothetical protein